ncbi:MAG: ribonuclease P protein component 1 [Methanohalobium sp.]|uniref:ribonuclease P protein component 1 n=1 Tax=Methanohalobium sp. TaxID=2837493 RepID=UPI00397B42C4
MERTPSNLIYHELIGLPVKVVESTNPLLDNICGRVEDETRNTLIIVIENDNKKMVPKVNANFVFKVSVDSGGKRLIKHVKVNGNLLLSQPENRTKNIKKMY